jgi:PAS domain S-box-containing protein
MNEKSTYEVLALKVKDLEREAIKRAQAEEALRESEECFRTLLDQASEAVFIHDFTGRLHAVNSKACNYLGYTENELLRLKLSDVDPDYKVSRYEEKFWSSVPTGFEGRHRRKDGSTFPVETRLSMIKLGGQQLVLARVSDITERKEVQEDFQLSGELLRMFVKHTPAAVAMCDRQMQYIAYSDRWTRDYNLGDDSLIGRSHYSLFPDLPKHWKEEHKRCFAGEVIKKEEESFPRADGSVDWVRRELCPWRHKSGEIGGLIMFTEVISDRKRMEDQLLQMQKLESIGTLAGGIAHDFNNILGVIVGNAELALVDLPDWNTAYAHLEEIKTAGLRAKEIVKQLLSFSRKTDQNLRPVQIAPVIDDAIKFLRATIPATIHIHQNIQATDKNILADPIQLHQVMMNLCVNASQAMEMTGGVIEINVESFLLDSTEINNYPGLNEGNYVKITVSDTGPGIPAEVIDLIFDPYFTTKEVGKGSGLGLAVVHGIVKNHNGFLSVSSENGKGTIFTVLFPSLEGTLKNESPKTEEFPTGRERILFVDDEKSIVKMTSLMLKKFGYQVESRMNPLEALYLFKSKPDGFDLVITDMTMPQMTGVQLTEKLMQIRPDIKIIICTGHSSLIDETKAKSMGIAAYVMKPIVMQAIGKTIRRVLDNV